MPVGGAPLNEVANDTFVIETKVGVGDDKVKALAKSGKLGDKKPLKDAKYKKNMKFSSNSELATAVLVSFPTQKLEIFTCNYNLIFIFYRM